MVVKKKNTTFTYVIKKVKRSTLLNDLNKNKKNIMKNFDQVQEAISTLTNKGELSDGYHSFNQLYDQRTVLTAMLFNIYKEQGIEVYKSRRHVDGKICFNDPEWFIVQAELPTGQASFHYHVKDWDLFNIKEEYQQKDFDGHTPEEALLRFQAMINHKG